MNLNWEQTGVNINNKYNLCNSFAEKNVDKAIRYAYCL